MKIRTAIISSVLALGVIGIVITAFLRPQERASVPEPAIAAQEAPAFKYEVVASQAARAQGLSGRAEVPGNYGMLFVFDVPDRYGFWMKDMLVPIDIIWLSGDGTILAIEENVSPSSYPTPFYPPQPVRLVLETRAGEAQAQGWRVGTRLALPL